VYSTVTKPSLSTINHQCIIIVEKQEYKHSGYSKLQHYFSELVDLAEQKWGKIQLTNNFTFKALQKCYETTLFQVSRKRECKKRMFKVTHVTGIYFLLLSPIRILIFIPVFFFRVIIKKNNSEWRTPKKCLSQYVR
jgi:hypothetical protein